MDLQEFCIKMSDLAGTCPVCGFKRTVIAVFKDNNSDIIEGFKVLCGCNTQEEMSQEYLASLRTYTPEEFIDNFVRKITE